MRFQVRDGLILTAIYRHGGLMAKRHLKTLFWPDASWRAMEMRLALLHEHGYLDWPNSDQRRNHAIPEPICWLGWKWAACTAEQYKIELQRFSMPTETLMRELDTNLRAVGIRWMREPRWLQIKHDLTIVDFRLAIARALTGLPMLAMESWVNEYEFASNTDVVTYSLPRARKNTSRERRVRPDSYFVLFDQRRLQVGLPSRARFLLEIDMGTHDNVSFAREKALVGSAYLASPAYRKRFGDNSGCWLVVTTSELRLKHLMASVSQAIGQGKFLFTTIDNIAMKNILTDPIWWQAGKDTPSALLG